MDVLSESNSCARVNIITPYSQDDGKDILGMSSDLPLEKQITGSINPSCSSSQINLKRSNEVVVNNSILPPSSKKRLKLNKSSKTENIDKTGKISIPSSKEAISSFNDNDVLSGRGGGTNVHPGNRIFRDLINLRRREYLKARKNDKPAISRAIVEGIRKSEGRFLRKDEKSGLWFEIGDGAAREKTSQALRQRAPEMRKILFDDEHEEARTIAEEQLRQQLVITSLNQGVQQQIASPPVIPVEKTTPINSQMLNSSLLNYLSNDIQSRVQSVPTGTYREMLLSALHARADISFNHFVPGNIYA